MHIRELWLIFVCAFVSLKKVTECHTCSVSTSYAYKTKNRFAFHKCCVNEWGFVVFYLVLSQSYSIFVVLPAVGTAGKGILREERSKVKRRGTGGQDTEETRRVEGANMQIFYIQLGYYSQLCLFLKCKDFPSYNNISVV